MNNKGRFEEFGVILIVIIVILILYAESSTYTSTDILLVKHKERIQTKDGGYYLIYTPEETFSCGDSFIFNKWNSSDQYGNIDIGKKYKFEVAGWRVPFLSMYRNIIKYSLVNEGVK